MQLSQRTEEIEVKAAAAEELDSHVRMLSDQAQQKAEALSAQEQQLSQFEQKLHKRESRLEAQAQRLDAQLQRQQEEEVCISYILVATACVGYVQGIDCSLSEPMHTLHGVRL